MTIYELRSVEKVIWSDESYTIFSKIWRVLVQHTPKEWCRPKGLTPHSKEGIGGSVMQWEVFCWDGLRPLVCLKQKITANQYKDLLMDLLYPMMEYFYPDGSGLVQDDSTVESI